MHTHMHTHAHTLELGAGPLTVNNDGSMWGTLMGETDYANLCRSLLIPILPIFEIPDLAAHRWVHRPRE